MYTMAGAGTFDHRDELNERGADLIAQKAIDRERLPGVPLKHVATPPSALPVKLDYQYFVLDRSGPDWEAIRRARNLAVYVPSDLPDPQLELVLLLPQPGS